LFLPSHNSALASASFCIVDGSEEWQEYFLNSDYIKKNAALIKSAVFLNIKWQKHEKARRSSESLD
jgi:hypothetical protein